MGYLFIFPCQAARMELDIVFNLSATILNSGAQFGELAAGIGVGLVDS